MLQLHPRPADPETGLPVQAFTSTSFRLWLISVFGTIVVAQLLLLWALATFQAEPPPPTPAVAKAGPAQKPALTHYDGSRLYRMTCTACHGAKGKGVPRLGKDITLASEFMRSQSEDALVELILNGRAADDPANTTKVAMPAKGGNDNLTVDEVRAIAKFLKTLKS